MTIATVIDRLVEQELSETNRESVPQAWHLYFESLPQDELNSDLGQRLQAQIERGELELNDELKQAVRDARSPIIGRFYGDFFFFVNIIGLVIQMFFVSRIFKFFGVRAALFVLPVIAFIGYGAIGLIGGLLTLRIAKTAENSTDYSLQNTVKQALFLPTSREAKYKAKATIDTFFVRFGDAASAGLVAIGIHVLNFGTTGVRRCKCFSMRIMDFDQHWHYARTQEVGVQNHENQFYLDIALDKSFASHYADAGRSTGGVV